MSQRATAPQSGPGDTRRETASTVPAPDVMPVDREAWLRELHLSNFINAFYVYRDIRSIGECRRILIVGPGQGLDTAVLRWWGYSVETFDIDPVFRPDHQGSVHDLGRFGAAQFDAIVVSHVLEHLAEPYLNQALAEIARVGKYALVYLPVAGRHAQIRIQPGFKGIDWNVIWDIFNYFDRCDGRIARFIGQQHFWEIGRRGFHVRTMSRRFNQYFDVLNHYRNRDWNPSYNFVLRSRAHR